MEGEKRTRYWRKQMEESGEGVAVAVAEASLNVGVERE